MVNIWDNRRGWRAEYEQILNIVLGPSNCGRLNVQGPGPVANVMVVFGDASSTLAAVDRRSLLALGVPGTKVDEYKTSSVCPRCDGAVRKEMRRVTCQACHVPIHGDRAGVHNIVRIGMAQILGNPRPLALQRPTQALAETAAMLPEVEDNLGLD
ncbi:hypothetical protein BGX28_002531 [Mortierella sp. GBA30]|nr:hypothetical protein BGX28_002531 [Mortierella sp. GBA30]